jgi:hypothetical protein
MALTLFEAQNRAKVIWGDQIVELLPHFNGMLMTGSWTIHLANGTWHYLDGNGHCTCHQECADVEVEILP